MKKNPLLSITAVLTAFGMLFSSIPVHGEELEILSVSTPEMILAEQSNSPTIYYPTTSPYCYEHLSEAGKLLYQNLLTACIEVENSSAFFESTPACKRPSGISDIELSDIISIFIYDHPEFFWIGKEFAKRGLSYVYLDIYQQYQDGTARNNARTEMMNVISGYISTALQLGTDYERAYYLANALRNSIIYNESEELSQSMISALTGSRSTVCAGLTKSYSYLCNAVGINTISMVGVNHAWNMVQLSGKWYYVDVTNRILFVSESELKNTSFARSHQNYTQTYPNPDDGLVMEGENQPKLYGCYDSRYYYYNNIFPESPASYDYASVPMQDRLEATSRKFKLNNLSNYYLSNDIVYVDMADLVSDFCLTNEYQNGDIISLTPLSLDNLKIKEGWRTPRQIYSHRQEGESYYHGGIPCTFGDIEFVVGDLWIGASGDCDLDGIPSASDAAAVLIYAAAYGAGETNCYLSQDSTVPESFVTFLTNESTLEMPTAETAAKILSLAAENGAGNT